MFSRFTSIDLRLVAWLSLAALSLGVHGWLPRSIAAALTVLAGAVSLRLALGATPRARHWAAQAAFATLALTLCAVGRPELVLLAAGTACFASDQLGRVPERSGFPFFVLGVTALGVALGNGAGQGLAEWVAGAASTGAGWLLPGQVDLGPTYAATPLVVVLAILVAAAEWPRRSKFAPAAALALGAVLLAVLVELAARTVPSFGSDPAGLAHRFTGASVPWLAALLAVGGGAAVLGRAATDGATLRRFAACSTAAAALALGSDPSSWRALPDPQSWVLYERGYHSWGRPDDQLFGEYSAGMLGTLPDFLASTGDSVRFVQSIEPGTMGDADGLVIINQDHPFDATGDAEIEALLERGGTVVVVGDHTFMKSDPETGEDHLYLNEPLAGYGIRFENDSSDPLTPAWDGSTVRPRIGGPATVAPGNPSGILVGGALHVDWPATRLDVGRHGYVDDGGSENVAGGKAWLGDLLWNPGERLGDVCLAAERRVGAGRLVVVGDTTGITNMGRLVRWEWWSDLLRGVDRRRPVWMLGAAAAFALFTVLSLRWKLASELAGGALAAGLIGLAFVEPRLEDSLEGVEQPLAVLDLALAPNGRASSWEDDGRAATLISAIREGYSGIVAHGDRAEVLSAADVLFVSAPQRPIEEDYVDRLLEQVERGLTLVVGCGAIRAANLERLFERLDIGIDPVALGPLRINDPQTRSEIFFREAWPLRMGHSGWRTRLGIAAGVLIAERELGDGLVVVASDDSFLSNRCLESKFNVEDGNIAWLRETIALSTESEVQP